MVKDALVLPAATLLAVSAHLAGTTPLAPLPPHVVATGTRDGADLADVRGQALGKRALEIAAAGFHSLLLLGPPGTGKSMLAHRLPALLPEMSEAEALESAAIASLAGRFSLERWRVRPFRAPHHTASSVALVGGGSLPRPGEISLAHHGVLFLDELPEWDRRVIEVLREPLESGSILVSRAARQTVFPAAFQLVAAMNPCPCGWLGHASGRCTCSPEQVRRYRSRVSGALYDRIDMAIEVPAVTASDMGAKAGRATRVESSQDVRVRVDAAHRRQVARQGKANARLAPGEVDRLCERSAQADALLAQAMSRLSLSARGYHRVLKVARTIADLCACATIEQAHVAEALAYRCGPPA